MLLRLRLFYKLVIKSVWSVAYVILFILGNFQTIIDIFPGLNTWMEKYTMTEPVKCILGWLAANWVYLFLISLSIAIFEGFYRKTKKYLGDRAKVDITLEEYPQNRQFVPHLSLKVINHEKADVVNCYGTLLELSHYYIPGQILDIKEIVNPNNKCLFWGGGSETERITIPRSDGVNHGVRVLNISKGLDTGVIFLFHGYEHNYQMHGTFRAKIKIDGEIGGTPIQSIVSEFCFIFGSHIVTSRQLEPEEHTRQRIIIQPSFSKSIFAFEDCDRIDEEAKRE